MRSGSSPRTPACPGTDEVRRRGRKGSVTMSMALLFLAFSVLGLSMLRLSQIHLKASAGRKGSMLLDYASENGIKAGLESVGGLVDGAGRLAEIAPDRFVEYREDALRSGTMIAADFLGWGFPREDRETWEGSAWSFVVTCPEVRAEDRGEYVSVTYGIRIDAEGSLSGFRQKRDSSCSASLVAMAGRLPLPFIPLLVDKEIAPSDRDGFMTANRITLRTRPGEIPPRLQAGGNPLIPGDALSQMAKALRIDVFRPEDLNEAVLRRALGLEPSSDPVPDGVYLIHDDLGLGGVFVMGDVAEMVVAIDGRFQVVHFAAGTGEWTLRFSPALCRTEFRGPEGLETFDLVPAGIICVNGAIERLGGGVVEATGEIRMVTDEAVPSILDGVGLTIVASERVAISSHLYSEGVRWRDGIPYLTDSNSQTVIFATGKDLLDGHVTGGEIAVAEGAPRDLTVQASLVASGAGFIVEGKDKAIELLGGLQASEIAMNGNALAISTDPSFGGGRTAPEGTPLTAVPLRYIAAFRVVEWREY